MEFEPDLKDLIQNDLRTEMNKILESDQNENEIFPSNPKLENLVFADQPFDLLPPSGIKADSIDLLNPSEPNKSNQPGISGHFAVERVLSSMTKQSENYRKSENDLSSLAWLTTVDVQQTLRQEDEVTEVGHPVVHPVEPTTPGNTSQIAPCGSQTPYPPQIPPNHMGNPQLTPSDPQTSQQRPQPRYTPIKPNLSPDAHPRYLLHPSQHGGNPHHPMYSYHPYPPPPYGSGYEGFPHQRYQPQQPKVFPKPVYSYSCLIAMSLRHSKMGCLPVSDIYSYMMENFPYFKTAPDGWKNSVRHNLSLNKCFEKVEKASGTQRKGCLWAMNPAKIGKMEEEVQKWKRKDPEAIRKSMAHPDEFDREMEELRRTDEASARRRMLSMACHGLSIPQHAYHPSGSTSLPTTPQHYHEYRQPMTPGHRVAADHSSTFQFLDGRQRQPRQLFACHANNQFPFGSPDVSSTPNNQRSMTSQSPHSSSDNSSLFGSLVDSIPTQHLNEIDLDSSLADLSVLQGSLWDGSGSSITPLDGPDPFEDNGAQPGNPLPDPTSIHMSEQVTSSEFTPNNRFHGNDLQFFNNKPVMLH